MVFFTPTYHLVSIERGPATTFLSNFGLLFECWFRVWPVSVAAQQSINISMQDMKPLTPLKIYPFNP